MKTYSTIQIALSSFIGTPLAASYLLSENIWTKYRRIGFAALALFVLCGGYVSIILLNPVESKLLDTGVFLVVTILILFSNHVLVDRASDDNPVTTERHGWWRTIVISALFLMVWLSLVVFVFNEWR